MRARWLILAATAVTAVLVVATWLGSLAPRPPLVPRGPGVGAADPLRLGLVSEGDVFDQRRRFRALADELEAALGRPIELVTQTTYDRIVDDFLAERVDAAIVGPLGAALLQQTTDARILARSVSSRREEAHRAVIFVRDDSHVRTLAELRGGSIALVRSTACGDLFPRVELDRHGLLDRESNLDLHWADGPETVVRMVRDELVDAGATMELWLDETEAFGASFRRLAASEMLPGPALVAPPDDTAGIGPALAEALVVMDGTGAGREALRAFGAVRFVRCEQRELEPIHDLIARLDGGWETIGLKTPSVRAKQAAGGG